MSRFSTGQRWSFRGAEAGATLVIGRIDRRLLREAVYHVSIDRPSAPVSHMPFSPKAIEASVLECLGDGVPTDPHLAAGIERWTAQAGGVFEIPVGEALAAIDAVRQAAVPSAPAFDFDGAIGAMREARSIEAAESVYARLLELDKWVILAQPQDGSGPVYWRFPEGLNPKPCVLIYTDADRAMRGAAEHGMLRPDGSARLINASVDECIGWMDTRFKDDGITWASFNHEAESLNLPVYFDAIKPLWAERQAMRP